jgi:hypothetical protein
VGAAAGTPSQLSRPAAPSQPNLALSQTAPRLSHAHQVELCFRRANRLALVSSASRAILPKRSANSKRDASSSPLPVSHGLTPIATDPSTCNSTRSKGAVTTSAWIDSNTLHQRGPAKLRAFRLSSYGVRAFLFPTTISPSKHENTICMAHINVYSICVDMKAS